MNLNLIFQIIENLKLIWEAHILNPIWLPRKARRQKRFAVYYKNVNNYLSKYKSFVESLEINNFRKDSETPSQYIFSIWFQSEEQAPPLVKQCFKRLRNVYGERVKVLDKESLKDWTNLPDYIWDKWEKGLITNAHFSDICRVDLLFNHGGMWFDATDYLTSPVPDWICQTPLFMFASGEKITPTTLIQSCFIKAEKNHPILNVWREFIFHYWGKEDRLIHYFQLHYMLRFIIENNHEVAHIFHEMPIVNQDPTHILWYQFRDKPYSQEIYLQATKDTFFQKTNFKMKSAKNPKADTIAYYMVNGKI